MIIKRVWAMPNKNTTSIKPIRELVQRYLKTSKLSVDPFAKDSTLCRITNDLNPATKAQHHMSASEFIAIILLGTIPDLVIFDPPYSLEQVKRSYEGIGKRFTHWDSQHAVRWGEEKDILAKIMPLGGIFIHFGWHTNGMGKKRGFEPIELLVVAHGGAHNDTLVLVEKKIK